MEVPQNSSCTELGKCYATWHLGAAVVAVRGPKTMGPYFRVSREAFPQAIVSSGGQCPGNAQTRSQ